MVAQVCRWLPIMTTLPISHSSCSYPNSFTEPAFDSEQVTDSALISKAKTIYAKNMLRISKKWDEIEMLFIKCLGFRSTGRSCKIVLLFKAHSLERINVKWFY